LKTEELRAEQMKVELRVCESSAKERERIMRAALKEMAGLADEAATAVEKGARQMAKQQKEIKKKIVLQSEQAEILVAEKPLLGSLCEKNLGGGGAPVLSILATLLLLLLLLLRKHCFTIAANKNKTNNK
jgi:hypothetical protein